MPEHVIKTSVDTETHRRLKSKLALRGLTITKWLRKKVDEELEAK